MTFSLPGVGDDIKLTIEAELIKIESVSILSNDPARLYSEVRCRFSGFFQHRLISSTKNRVVPFSLCWFI